MKTIIKAIVIISGISLLLFLSGCSRTDSVDQHQHRHETAENNLYTCGMHPEVILEEPGQCPICGMNLTPLNVGGTGNTPPYSDSLDDAVGLASESTEDESRVMYWQAPMDPTEIYDHPGKSKMGMDLVPVYENKISAGSRVSIDAATVQNMGVRSMPAVRQTFSREIRTVGKVDYNEERIFEVSSKISGWIENLSVNYTGKAVRKGQVLLELYSPELVTTQQEYLLALSNREMINASSHVGIREGAESLLAATRQRLKYWDIPESAIKQLEDERQVSKTIAFESPADGVVIHKNAVEGKFITAGSSLYRIADLSTVWVFASLYDNEVPWVQVGQKAEMELSYAPGKVLSGRVAYIYPYLNEQARDVKVRLEFPNPDRMLKPGMYANVRISTPSIPDALVIPGSAVIRSGTRNLVFVAQGRGRFEPRPVRLGAEDNQGQVLVLAGLQEGEEIVTSAQFLLDSESRLQETIQKMLQEKAAARVEPGSSEMQSVSGDNLSRPQTVTDEQPASESMQHEHSPRDQSL